MLKGHTTGTRLSFSLRQRGRRPLPSCLWRPIFSLFIFPCARRARARARSVGRSPRPRPSFWGIEFLLLFSEVADLPRQRCTRRLRRRPSEAGCRGCEAGLRGWPRRPFRLSLADERRKKESAAALASCWLSLPLSGLLRRARALCVPSLLRSVLHYLFAVIRLLIDTEQ